MPRKAPDSVQELRVTFGNKERSFIEEQMKQARTNAIIKGVGTGGIGLGVVVIGGGLAVAAFAFYHWAGLSDLPGKIKDTALGVSAGIGETILGTTVEKQVDQFLGPITQQLAELKEKCAEELETQQEIVSNPNSSENQIAQANLQIINITRKCKQRYQHLMQKMKAGLDNPELIALEGTWVGNLMGL